jgi:type IV secretion system protein VirB2
MLNVLSFRPLAVRAAASLALTVGLGASAAFAQAGGGGGSLAPLENGLAFIQQFLSGAFGTTIAIISVIVCGYLALAGRITWFVCGAVVMGIALIFGAPTIVSSLQAAVGR